jgi:hypothetical protein
MTVITVITGIIIRAIITGTIITGITETLATLTTGTMVLITGRVTEIRMVMTTTGTEQTISL